MASGTVTRRWDAVVVGAGPAGAASALLLARGGASVLLLDRARFPRDKPCSEYLSPETTRILARLGGDVLSDVEQSVHARLFGMTVVAPDGTAMTGRFARSDHGYSSPRPYGFALARTRFDAILRRAAERAGAVVEEAVSVDDLITSHGAVTGVMARSARGARAAIRGRVVIGADGLRSVIARRLGLRRSGPPRRYALTTHLAGVADVGDVGEMHIGEGYVGLGPIGGGETTIALVLPRDAMPSGHDFHRDMLPRLNRFPGLKGRFDEASVAREVLAIGPFAQWSRHSVAPGGGACLVGDAADFFDPFTGQGIHAALRGAELVATTVLAALPHGRGALTRDALAPYARARRRALWGKWVLERLIGLGVGWPALATRVVRRLAGRPDLADLLVGATGNFIPAGRVLTPMTLAQLLL